MKLADFRKNTLFKPNLSGLCLPSEELRMGALWAGGLFQGMFEGREPAAEIRYVSYADMVQYDVKDTGETAKVRRCGEVYGATFREFCYVLARVLRTIGENKNFRVVIEHDPETGRAVITMEDGEACSPQE